MDSGLDACASPRNDGGERCVHALVRTRGLIPRNICCRKERRSTVAATNSGWWLRVPAFAGTTAERALRASQTHRRRRPLRRFRKPVVERVARAAHGADRILLATRIEELAQAADMHVDGTLVDIDVAAPD